MPKALAKRLSHVSTNSKPKLCVKPAPPLHASRFLAADYEDSMRSTSFLSPSKATSALLAAAHNGRADLIPMLLAAGADPTRKNGMRATALHLASQQGHVACVLLLAARSDMAAQDDHRHTPLMRAALGCHAECLEILGARDLEEGAIWDILYQIITKAPYVPFKISSTAEELSLALPSLEDRSKLIAKARRSTKSRAKDFKVAPNGNLSYFDHGALIAAELDGVAARIQAQLLGQAACAPQPASPRVASRL